MTQRPEPPIKRERVLPDLGAKVREARVEADLTQEELAEICGLHRTYIGGVERGERNVSVVNLCNIAFGLGVAPSDLIAPLDSALGHR